MMRIEEYLNKEIELKITYPIDFGEENGTGPYRGRIVAIKPTQATIFLLKRLYYRGEPLLQLKARPSLPQDTFLQMSPSKFLTTQLTSDAASISQLSGALKLIP